MALRADAASGRSNLPSSVEKRKKNAREPQWLLEVTDTEGNNFEETPASVLGTLNSVTQ